MRRRGFVTAPLVVIALTLVSLAGLWRLVVRPERAPIGVVIITLDTTRADRLPAYGYMDAVMPHLDRLAREGIVFDRATSVGPLTLPAHCSLFTALFPPTHGVHDNADPALSPEHTTLAEILHARGFRTGAFVGSIVLDADRGLSQGFEQYSSVADGAPRDRSRPGPLDRRANLTVDKALQWLGGVGDSHFFLWVHLYDPHRPYDPPEPYRSANSDPYIGEIAFADSQVGRLLEALDRRGRLDRTVVVVAGDHGESLGDHSERDHGVFVYESVLRVPLILRAPGVAPGRIGDVVRLVDVMPTVLDLLGVQRPTTDGVSLADAIHGRPGRVDLEAYSESLYPRRFGWSPLRSLRAGRFKLIEAPRPELYDLERDPFEQRNIYEERRSLADTLQERLAALERGGPLTGRGNGEDLIPGEEMQERLASLGYVGSGGSPATSARRDLPDPKDCIRLHGSVPMEPAASLRLRCGGPASRQDPLHQNVPRPPTSQNR
jgi:choline-sulfatase